MRGNFAQRAIRRGHGAGFAMLLSGTVLASGQAWADAPPPPPPASDSAEIVVTAQKREENVQKVPISIQALSARKLEEHQVTNFDDYAKLLPSVSYQSYGPGQSQIYFRGITSGSDANGSFGGSQPTSALYLDEVPLTTIGGAVDVHVYDIQRVEALSGPQGTLFGSSSLSGTLRIITNPPSHKTEAGFDISGTTYGRGPRSNGGSFDGYFNLPITDKVALRASAFYERDGGYISNVPGTRAYPAVDFNGNPNTVTVNNARYARKNFNDTETYGGRAALGIDLDSNWTATPTIIYQNQKAHGTFLYGPLAGNDPLSPAVGDLRVQDYTPELNADEWVQAALTIHGKLGNWDVTYAGGYFDRHVDTQADYSGYTVNYYEAYGAAYTSFYNGNGQNVDPSQLYHIHHHYTKQSHELRISSPSTNRIRLTSGLFLQRQTDQIAADYVIPGFVAGIDDGTGNRTSPVPRCGYNGANNDIFCSRIYRVDRDYAGFADVAYDILDNLTLDAGVRLFITDNSAQGFSGTAKKVTAPCVVTADPNLPCLLYDRKASEKGETHKFTLTWKIDPRKLIYATYSTGYRPGGINRLQQVNPYIADTLSNYEIGAKTAWFDRHLIVNVAIFDEEWKNVQIGLTTPNSNGVVSIYNVGSARVKGVEGDFNLALDHLTLSGSAAYTDGKTKSDFCNIGAGGNPDCAGQGVYIPGGTRLPVQPQFKGNLTARYHFDWNGLKPYIQATANHQSGTDAYFVQPRPDALFQTSGFTTIDFALGARLGQWSWEAYAINAFDKRGILSLNTSCIPSTCAQFARAYPTKPQQFGFKLGTKF